MNRCKKNDQDKKIAEWKNWKVEGKFSEIASYLILSTEMKNRLINKSLSETPNKTDDSIDKTLILETKYLHQFLKLFTFNQLIKLISAIENDDTLDGSDAEIIAQEVVVDFALNRIYLKDVTLELLVKLKSYIDDDDKDFTIFTRSVSLINNAESWVFVNDNLKTPNLCDLKKNEWTIFKKKEKKFERDIEKVVLNNLSLLIKQKTHTCKMLLDILECYPQVYKTFSHTLPRYQQEKLLEFAYLELRPEWVLTHFE